MNAILTVKETKRTNGKFHYIVAKDGNIINQHYSNNEYVAVVLDSHKPIYCKTIEMAETYKKKYNLEIAFLTPAK